MRHILRRRELVEDEWCYFGEGGTEAGPLVVPFAEFRTHIARWRSYTDPLGVRLSPADKIEDLADDVGVGDRRDDPHRRHPCSQRGAR